MPDWRWIQSLPETHPVRIAHQITARVRPPKPPPPGPELLRFANYQRIDDPAASGEQIVTWNRPQGVERVWVRAVSGGGSGAPGGKPEGGMGGAHGQIVEGLVNLDSATLAVRFADSAGGDGRTAGAGSVVAPGGKMGGGTAPGRLLNPLMAPPMLPANRVNIGADGGKGADGREVQLDGGNVLPMGGAGGTAASTSPAIQAAVTAAAGYWRRDFEYRAGNDLPFNSLVLNPTRTRLAAAENNINWRGVALFAVAPGPEFTLLSSVGQTGLATAAGNHDGTLVAVTGGALIHVYSTAEDKLTPVPGSPFTSAVNASARVQFSPNGQYLAACHGSSNRLRVFSVAANGALTQVGSDITTRNDNGVWLDNTRFVTHDGGSPGTLRLFTVSASAVTPSTTLAVSSPSWIARLSGQRIAVSCFGASTSIGGTTYNAPIAIYDMTSDQFTLESVWSTGASASGGFIVNDDESLFVEATVGTSGMTTSSPGQMLASQPYLGSSPVFLTNDCFLAGGGMWLGVNRPANGAGGNGASSTSTNTRACGGGGGGGAWGNGTPGQGGTGMRGFVDLWW